MAVIVAQQRDRAPAEHAIIHRQQSSRVINKSI